MPVTQKLPRRTGWMRSAWMLRKNPLPTEAIARDDDPYSDDAFSDEIEQFVDRVIVGGLSPNRQITFLYSHNRHGGEDTGFAKTRLMLRLRTTINEDLGQSVLENLVDDDELIPIGAAYGSFN